MMCDDCLYCESNPDGNCIVAAHDMCDACGHCLGNHSERSTEGI